MKNALQFRSILRAGSHFQENGIGVYFSDAGFGKGSRLGIIVSRRVLRNATARNRMKRIVREFFRLRKSGFRRGYDVVVKFMASSNSFQSNNLRRTLGRLFERAGVFGADA
ncbi:MAG: ribonuclease P protein component [Candidatus Omnitrophica bacterium]|nr:ribonuclease P protein component [Candidatus Omnitrophota bacterium]